MPDTGLLRALAERPDASTDRKALQRYDSLQAALDIFVAEGIDAVRITRLADDLGMTRGSFYWHFKNRQDMIDALVNFWKCKNTPALIAAVERARTLEEGILGFFEICVDATHFDPRLDLAIREWARRSENIRHLLDQEDQVRIDALQQYFLRFDYPMPEALIRARVLYFSQIGFYALDVPEPLRTRLEYTEAYYQCFTGQALVAATADQFRHDIIHRYGDQIP